MISRQYLAGFFDGEGCVNLTVRGKCRQVCLRVMIVNTDPEILQSIHLQIGGNLCKPKVSQDGWKAFRSLVLTGREAFEFLVSIYPHSIIKKRQIKLAMEFWNFQQLPKRERCEPMPRGGSRRKQETIEKEIRFKEQMHDLNRKGMVQ